MHGKEAAKEIIGKLVAEFRANHPSCRKFSEADTETKLIEPLFEALGWARNDFIKREKVRRGQKLGFADYTFRMGERTAFFLEAKKVSVSIDKEADRQVISYALSKRIPFAVATNFDQLYVYCVEEWNESRRIMIAIKSPEEYLSKFDELWLISKESFGQGMLLHRAEDLQLLKKRISIDKILLDDLMAIRKMIANDIEKRYPEKYNANEKDEIVQRIIDRLIFIRHCEDLGINPENMLLEDIRQLSHDRTYSRLKAMFREYDTVYNSGLFAPAKDNDCDAITIDGGIIQKLARYLYESQDGKYIYNFHDIDADVLGQVYEQYLGRVLAQTTSGRAKLREGQAHRKEQGIYYTPTYIVDYIVKNTLGEMLKDRNIDPSSLKILDPACGSGSFLIKAFDCLNGEFSSSDAAKQKRIDSQGAYSIKTEILKNNLYGVDLDQKAVEITKLNLLLKAADAKRRLPEELDLHIKHGNSLIDDSGAAGSNAFKWEEKFPDIVRFDSEGKLEDGYGFDVIIGNPPWLMAGYHLDKEIDYLRNKYQSAKGKFDLYYCFIELGLKLLSKRGLFGMIVPNKFFHTKSGTELRNLLKDSGKLYRIIDFGDEQIFGDATNYSSIILLRGDKHSEVRYSFVDSQIQSIKETTIETKKLSGNGWFFEDEQQKYIFDKMEKAGIHFEKIVRRFGTGAQTGADKVMLISPEKLNDFKEESSLLRKMLRGRDVRRYSIASPLKNVIFPYKIKSENFEIIEENEIKKHKKIYKILESEKGRLSKRVWFGKNAVQLSGKWYGFMYLDNYASFNVSQILTPSLSNKSNFTIGKDILFVTGTAGVTSIILKDIPEDIKFILGLLNSKLIEFYILNHSPVFQGGYHKFSSNYLKKIPIKKLNLKDPSDKKIHEQVVKFVDKLLFFHSSLSSFGSKKTSETARLEEEIRKTDAEIDDLVYRLYGITEEERKTIEESLK